MGIEPTHARATIWCVNHFTTPAIIILTRAVGIEPTLKVLETLVLPLNYARKGYGRGGIRTPEPEGADLQSAAFSLFATLPKNVDTPLGTHIYINQQTVSKGFEPSISAVTRQRDNHYATKPNVIGRI